MWIPRNGWGHHGDDGEAWMKSEPEVDIRELRLRAREERFDVIQKEEQKRSEKILRQAQEVFEAIGCEGQLYLMGWEAEDQEERVLIIFFFVAIYASRKVFSKPKRMTEKSLDGITRTIHDFYSSLGITTAFLLDSGNYEKATEAINRGNVRRLGYPMFSTHDPKSKRRKR